MQKAFQIFEKCKVYWSDYGVNFRLTLQSEKVTSVVVKCISLQEQENHPRAWTHNLSHGGKLKSYLIENPKYEKNIMRFHIQ